MSEFIDFSIIIVLAAAISMVMRALRQPLIIGHIITGLLVGALTLSGTDAHSTLELFGHLGIAFLLFVVGIHLSPDVVRKFGKVAFVAGIGQVIIATIAGWGISRLLGFSDITSWYIGASLAFSSTIIILKFITDKGDLDSLYANISIGFLIVQDIVAIALLFVIPVFASGDGSMIEITNMLGTGAALIIAIILVAHYILPLVDQFISRSLEMLLLFSIAWGMGIAALFLYFGFAIESGALIAGIGLARLQSRHEISSRLTPLRDFFLILFFIVLGSQMQISGFSDVLIPALILSLFVIVSKPIVVGIILKALRYRKKTSLKTGFTIAQISEFSIILVGLGMREGQIDASVLSLVTLVALITIFASSYMMKYVDLFYRRFGSYLSFLERPDARESRTKKKKYDVIVLGCNRMGSKFFEQFKSLNEKLLVVDHNPDVINVLHGHQVSYEFGDASDIDFLDSLNLKEAKLIISTIPDAETNFLINKAVSMQESRAFVVVVAHRVEEALEHYDNGANYVIVPHILGGEYAVKIVKKYTKGDKDLKKIKEKHIKSLSSGLDKELLG